MVTVLCALLSLAARLAMTFMTASARHGVERHGHPTTPPDAAHHP